MSRIIGSVKYLCTIQAWVETNKWTLMFELYKDYGNCRIISSIIDWHFVSP